MEIKYPKYRWFVMLTMFLATVGQGMILISPSPLVGPISEQLNISLGQTTGLLMVTFNLFVALSGIAGGMIVDKIGLPKTYIISLILMIVGALLMPLAGTSVAAIVALRVLQGIGAGPVIATIAKVAADWFPVSERGIVTGTQGAALSLGIALGFAVGPKIFIATGQWHLAVAGMSVVSIVALIFSIIFAFGPKPIINAAAEQNFEALEESGKLFRLAIKQPAFLAGATGSFALSWVQQAYNDLTPGNIAVDPPIGLGLGPIVSGQIMAVYQLAFMIGSFACGFILYKIFKGKANHLAMLAFLITAVFCLSVMIPGVKGNQTVLTVCLIIAGFFMSMPNPSIMAFISTAYPESITGRVGGTSLGISIFGGTIGVAVGSVALHTTGMYKISIIIVGIVAVLGAISSMGLKVPQIFAKQTD